MKKLLLVIMCVCLVMLNGCGGSKNKPITIGVSAFPGWFVWYIAEGEGFFKKNNVDVKLVWFPVYSDSLQAFNSGKVDMLCIAMCDAIAPYEKGVGFKAVLVNDNSYGGDGLVAKDKYKAVEDLKGKTVATEYGTVTHFFLRNCLERYGLTEKDVNLVNMTVQDAGPAVIAGAIDAASLWEPTLSLALAQEDNVLLFSTRQALGLIADLTVASDKLLQTRRDDVKAAVNAFFDALEFYGSNPDKAISHMAKIAEVSDEEMKQVMSGAKLYSLEDNVNSMTVPKEHYTYLPFTAYENAKFLKDVNMINKTYSQEELRDNIIDSSIVLEIAKVRKSVPAPDTSL